MPSDPTVPVTPRDVLPDGADTVELNGMTVRKGSVAAFIANAKLLESFQGTPAAREALLAQLRELVPTLRAVGLFDVFEPRSEEVRVIVAQG